MSLPRRLHEGPSPQAPLHPQRMGTQSRVSYDKHLTRVYNFYLRDWGKGILILIKCGRLFGWKHQDQWCYIDPSSICLPLHLYMLKWKKKKKLVERCFTFSVWLLLGLHKCSPHVLKLSVLISSSRTTNGYLCLKPPRGHFKARLCLIFYIKHASVKCLPAGIVTMTTVWH